MVQLVQSIRVILYEKPPENLLCALQIWRLRQDILQVQVSYHLSLHGEEASLENKLRTEILPLE
jgi:hypothetical protein